MVKRGTRERAYSNFFMKFCCKGGKLRGGVLEGIGLNKVFFVLFFKLGEIIAC